MSKGTPPPLPRAESFELEEQEVGKSTCWIWHPPSPFHLKDVALTKPDVSFLVVITTLAGYALGAVGPLDWLRMAQTVIGTTLVAAGTKAPTQNS